VKKVTIAARLGIRPAAPDVIAHYACDGPAMVGVIRIVAGSSDHNWERHGGGDEVLYLLAGRASFTAVGAAGTDEVLVEAGDVLVLERDEAHRGRALEDVTVLFLTPRDGNVAWSDEEGAPPLGQRPQR
jgi:quercetin dioxygenase-like cupin family protein